MAALEAEAAHSRRATDDVIRLTGPQPVLDDIMRPVICAFLAQCPKARFEYSATRDIVDLQAGDADVALRAADAVEGDDVVCRRLPPFQWGVYCSRDYAQRNGAPTCVDEVRRHRVIGLSGAVARNNAYRWFCERVPPEAFMAHCDSHTNMRAILASGTGVGPTTRNMGENSPDLMRCFPPPAEMRTPCWLLISPQASRRKTVRAFVDFATPRIVGLLREKQRARP